MARKMTEWPSERGPISKIRPSDGCGRAAVPLAGERRYDYHELGYRLGNIGLYNLLKVLDDEALARARWNAMFEHVKWADAEGALDVEVNICGRIEPLQRGLVARWRLHQASEGE